MNLGQRIARLEAETASFRNALVWRNRDETAAQAVARHVGNKAGAARTSYLVLSWRWPAMAGGLK